MGHVISTFGDLEPGYSDAEDDGQSEHEDADQVCGAQWIGTLPYSRARQILYCSVLAFSRRALDAIAM